MELCLQGGPGQVLQNDVGDEKIGNGGILNEGCKLVRLKLRICGNDNQRVTGKERVENFLKGDVETDRGELSHAALRRTGPVPSHQVDQRELRYLDAFR